MNFNMTYIFWHKLFQGGGGSLPTIVMKSVFRYMYIMKLLSFETLVYFHITYQENVQRGKFSESEKDIESDHMGQSMQ